MKFKLTILLALLVASGCARDEFGTKDSGDSVSLPTVSEETDPGENEPEGSPVNGSPDANNLSSPDPEPTTDQGFENVAPSALLAMEALTRATFTDISSSTGNFVFSPLALASTLTVAGLAGDGAMRDAVAGRLAETDLESVAVGLADANRLIQDGQDGLISLPTMWVDPSTSLNSDFLASVVPELIQDVRTVDFSSLEQARQTINNYYRTQTSAVLPSVVGPLALKAGQRAALVHAVYFQGSWALPFSAEDTAEGVFRGDGGDVTTAFMRVHGEFLVQREEDYDAIVVPYQSNYDLVLIKPTSAGARARLEGQFSIQLLTDIVVASQLETIHLQMPRVDVEGRLESNLFGGEVASNAERAGAFSTAGLESSGALIQRAVISFDEAGTGAPNPSDNVGSVSGGEFVLDQPYLFGIRESSTGFVLLAGRVSRL